MGRRELQFRSLQSRKSTNTVQPQALFWRRKFFDPTVYRNCARGEDLSSQGCISAVRDGGTLIIFNLIQVRVSAASCFGQKK